METRGTSGATSGLLERTSELEMLADAVAAARDGRASALVIEGDAGVGKSALLEAATQIAEREELTVLRARGGSLERTLGWGVARQLFEALIVRAAPATRGALLRGSAALAAPLLGVADAINEPQGSTHDSQLEHGLYWLTSNLTERTPLALLIDDAHWCDDTTLGWWLYLLRRTEGLPLLMIIGTRSGEPGAPTALLDLIAAEPIVRTTRLRTLGVESTEELLERTYGSPVDHSFGLACHAWTGGNPLFVSELAAELATEGVEPVASAAPRVRSLTPTGASRVTLLRLSRLSEQALELARATAVLDPTAEQWLARALAALSEDDVGAALDELVEGRILSAANQLTFVHPLIGAIVYDDLPAARRADMHRRAAQLLVEAGSEPGLISAHLLRTRPAGDPWVVTQLLAGAEIELGLGSPSTAVELLRRARREPPTHTALGDTLFALGRAEARAGDRAATDTLRQALVESGDSRQRGEIALTLGRLSVRAGQPESAIELVRTEADRLAWENVDIRLQLEALLITLARFAGGQLTLISERQTLIRDRATGDTHGGRLVAAQLAWSLSARAQPAERTAELARTAIANGQLIREAPDTPEAWLGAVHMLTMADQLDEADTHWSQALTEAEKQGSEAAFAAASCYRSTTAYLSGRLDQAELYARDSLRTTSSSLSLIHRIATAHLAHALVDRGALPEAFELLEVGDTPVERLPRTWGLQTMLATGRAHVVDDRPDEGAELLLEAGQLATASGILNPAWLPWRSEAAIALHRLGRGDEALELCDQELDLARRVGARRPIGAALRARGLVIGGEAGIALLQESAEMLAASPARLEHARTLVALGGARRRANHRAKAREPLSEGLLLADQCGAEPLAAEARSELKAAGSRPRALLRTGSDALTASERRVCELAAAGKTNREIAQLLFVTRATVESHLHSAYRRLDVGSRTELAGVLATEA